MSGPAPILTARGLRFAYRGGMEALRGIDITAVPGRLSCVLGPNGSGKTTLLRCLLGYLKPSGGTVELNARPMDEYAPRVRAKMLAYVPQTPACAFAFTVRQIVLMGRFAHSGALGLAGREDMEVARLAMEMTQTLEFAGRGLDELSGGEAQCVMIARALAQQPGVMLLDEPTSQLDIRNQLKIYRLMRRLAHEWGMAVVCVSHDVNLAGRFADEIVLMRQGSVVAAGPPEEVIRREILAQAYQVEIELIRTENRPVPFVWAE